MKRPFPLFFFRKFRVAMVIAGVVSAFLLSGANFPESEPTNVFRQITARDTFNPLLVPVDSIEFYPNLRFKTYKTNVHASYYHNKFNGKRTASGKKFNNNRYMAAHRKFPFGTKLRVTNQANGECVIVEVSDRGPFTKGREIDMSRRAFMDIAHNKKSGGLNVTIEVIY
jgi:rare lipoprotein A